MSTGFETYLRAHMSLSIAEVERIVLAAKRRTLQRNEQLLQQGQICRHKTFVEKGRLTVQIRNSGHLTNGVKRSSKGLGLKNTVQRLKLIYGGEASFRIVNENDNFVLTEFVIPTKQKL